MPKITRTDITNLGFTKDLFTGIIGQGGETAFGELLDGIIADESETLADRLGSVYDIGKARYVKNAERCLVAAELIRRRINIILANAKASGQEITTQNENKQRKDYLDEAEGWIAKIAQGVAGDSTKGDFSSGSLVSSHFDGG